MSRPNYYILLDLDPSVKAAGKVEAAIKKKQAEWTRDRNHPKKGREAHQCLDFVPDIKKVMADPELRGEEAKEAKRVLKEREREAMRELDEHLDVLAGRGYLLEQEVKKLAKQLKGKFTEEQIRARIKVPIRKAEQKKSAARPTLDTTIVQEIDNRLKVVSKKNLYDFLKCGKSSSVSVLISQTRKLDALIRSNNNKDALNTAQSELVGYCLRVFKDDAERQKYDNSQAMQGLRELEPFIRTAGADGVIGPEETESLLRKARDRGVSAEEAREHIIAMASKQGWSVQVPQQSAAARLLQCGTCGVSNPESASACKSCGEPLWENCPKCNQRSPSENLACPKCGFSIGNASLVRRLIREARLDLASGDDQAAEQRLKEASVYWGESREISDILNEVQQQREKKASVVKGVMNAINSHQFLAAQTLLVDLAHVAPNHPKLSQFRKRTDAALAAARQQANRAATLERGGKTEEAVAAYSEALRECRDYRDAQDGLAKHPPQPARNLRVTPTTGGIDLRWQASGSRGRLEYCVIRKSGSRPKSSTDGKVVATTATTSLTDSDVAAGEICYYAVYADRGGVLSATGASSRSVLRVAEVGRLKAVSGDGRASLNWEAPDGAREIEVWRKPGAPPRRRNDGVRAKTDSLQSAADTGLKNDQSYGYRVVVVFDGPDGKPVYSPGVTCSAIPAKPPQPITDLSVVQEHGNYEAMWAPIRTGQVHVFASAIRPSYQCGQTISPTEAAGIGRRVPAIGATQVRDSLGGQCLLNLTPVTVSGTVAVVGQSVSVSCVDDVQGLRLSAEDGTLAARWQWPSGIQMAVVAYRTDRFPSSAEDDNATRERFSWHKYESQGCFRCPLPDTGQVYLAVYSAVRDGDALIYSSGTGQGARSKWDATRHLAIRYRVARKSRLLGLGTTDQFELTIQTDGEVTLPELVLVGKAGGLPLCSTMGRTVARVTEGSLCSRERPLRSAFRVKDADRSWKFRLFAAQEEVSQWIELHQSR